MYISSKNVQKYDKEAKKERPRQSNKTKLKQVEHERMNRNTFAVFVEILT